jgi:hypothetical protein
MNTQTNNAEKKVNSLIHKVERCYFYKKSENTNSKFAPKKRVVYVLPSIDDCIAQLPKEVGNHILSYTNAWLDFMLLHILEKYGLPFFKKLLVEFLFKNIKWEFKKYKTGLEIIKAINHNFYTFREIDRKNVANNIKIGLDYRQQQIILKKENQIKAKIDRTERDRPLKTFISHLLIGQVVRMFGNNVGIVISKGAKEYYVLVSFDFEILGGELTARFNLDHFQFTNETYKGLRINEIKPTINIHTILLKENVRLNIRETQRSNKKLTNSIIEQIENAENA